MTSNGGAWNDGNADWSTYYQMMSRQAGSPVAREAGGQPVASTTRFDEDMDVITISDDQPMHARGGQSKKESRRFAASKNNQDGPSQQPAPASAWNNSAPTAAQNPFRPSNPANMDRDQMAKRIQALEQENAQLRAAVADAASTQKNFPRCYPMVRNNIREDIPLERQVVVRTALFAWIMAFLGYLLGWFVITLQLITSDGKGFRDWIIACVIVIVGIPASWYFWYKNLYKSQMTDRSFPYAKFFLNGFVHMAWCVWAIVSPPFLLGESTAGVFNFQETTTVSGGYGVFLTIMTIVVIACWALSLLAMMVVFSWANSYFRNSPAVKADKEREKKKFASKMFTYAFASKEPVPAPSQTAI